MVRAVDLSEQVFPQTRTVTYSSQDGLDTILSAVGFCGADEALGNGSCDITFPTAESVRSFYKFIDDANRKPRAIRLAPAT